MTKFYIFKKKLYLILSNFDNYIHNLLGEGIVEKKPQTLAKKLTDIMINAEFRTTDLLAILVIAMHEIFSEYDVTPPKINIIQ